MLKILLFISYCSGVSSFLVLCVWDFQICFYVGISVIYVKCKFIKFILLVVGWMLLYECIFFWEWSTMFDHLKLVDRYYSYLVLCFVLLVRYLSRVLFVLYPRLNLHFFNHITHAFVELFWCFGVTNFLYCLSFLNINFQFLSFVL